MPWLNALVAIGTAAAGKRSTKKRQRRADQMEADREAKADALEQKRLGLAERADARATEADARYKNVLQPLEDQYIRRLQRPVDTDGMAAAAGADVQRAVATQSDSIQRVLRRRGLRASDPAAAAAEASLGLGAARARAAAMTGARRQGVQDTNANWARLAEMAGVGFNRADSLRRSADGGMSDVYGGSLARLSAATRRATGAAEDNAAAGGALGDAVGKYMPDLEDGFRRWLGSATLGGG